MRKRTPVAGNAFSGVLNGPSHCRRRRTLKRSGRTKRMVCSLSKYLNLKTAAETDNHSLILPQTQPPGRPSGALPFLRYLNCRYAYKTSGDKTSGDFACRCDCCGSRCLGQSPLSALQSPYTDVILFLSSIKQLNFVPGGAFVWNNQ